MSMNSELIQTTHEISQHIVDIQSKIENNCSVDYSNANLTFNVLRGNPDDDIIYMTSTGDKFYAVTAHNILESIDGIDWTVVENPPVLEDETGNNPIDNITCIGNGYILKANDNNEIYSSRDNTNWQLSFTITDDSSIVDIIACADFFLAMTLSGGIYMGYDLDGEIVWKQQREATAGYTMTCIAYANGIVTCAGRDADNTSILLSTANLTTCDSKLSHLHDNTLEVLSTTTSREVALNEDYIDSRGEIITGTFDALNSGSTCKYSSRYNPQIVEQIGNYFWGASNDYNGFIHVFRDNISNINKPTKIASIDAYNATMTTIKVIDNKLYINMNDFTAYIVDEYGHYWNTAYTVVNDALVYNDGNVIREHNGRMRLAKSITPDTLDISLDIESAVSSINSMCMYKDTIIAVGSQGIYRSDDKGFWWSPIHTELPPTMTNINEVINVNGIFYAAGTGCIIASRDDGITWETVCNTTTSLTGITYIDKLIAYGRYGTVITSSDGIRWTENTILRGVNNIFNVKYYNNTFFALGQGGLLLSSSNIDAPMEEWNDLSFTTENLIDLIYDGSKYLLFSRDGIMYSSTDTKVWTERIIRDAITTINDVIYVNGMITLVGYDGVIITSKDDGIHGITFTEVSTDEGYSIHGVSFFNNRYYMYGQFEGKTDGYAYSNYQFTPTYEFDDTISDKLIQTVEYHNDGYRLITRQDDYSLPFSMKISGIDDKSSTSYHLSKVADQLFLYIEGDADVIRMGIPNPDTTNSTQYVDMQKVLSSDTMLTVSLPYTPEYAMVIVRSIEEDIAGFIILSRSGNEGFYSFTDADDNQYDSLSEPNVNTSCGSIFENGFTVTIPNQVIGDDPAKRFEYQYYACGYGKKE